MHDIRVVNKTGTIGVKSCNFACKNIQGILHEYNCSTQVLVHHI